MANPILYGYGDKLERTLSVAIFLIVFTCAIVILLFNIDSIRLEISHSKLFFGRDKTDDIIGPFSSCTMILFAILFFRAFDGNDLLLIWRCTTKVAHVMSEVFRDDHL